jgi:hypothetical protein
LILLSGVRMGGPFLRQKLLSVMWVAAGSDGLVTSPPDSGNLALMV